MKKVTIKKLSTKEVDKAIKEVRKYKDDLNLKVETLVKLLTSLGVQNARVNVRQMGAFDSGNLQNHITDYYNAATGIGCIRADTYYAIYVEFGTGSIGQSASHPLTGQIGYEYDKNGHGKNGWYYFNQETGKSGWTNGMPSRPFMYEALLEVRKNIPSVAKKVLR